MSTTEGPCRTIWTSCSRPLGKRRFSTSTEKTRPLKTVAMNVLRQLVEYTLQVRGQPAFECHAASVGGMCEDEPRGVKERAIEMRHRAQVARHAAVDAAVDRISDDRVTDGAQVNPNLVCAARVDGDACKRERPAEMIRADDPRDRFAAAPDPCAVRQGGGVPCSCPCADRRHLLPVHWIAADRRVD